MIGDKNFFGLYRGVGRLPGGHGVVGVVLTNYRLSPLVKHPEHVKDVARAFAWTTQDIAQYGGDPDRIVLAGHSAGRPPGVAARHRRQLPEGPEAEPRRQGTARRSGRRRRLAASTASPTADEFRPMAATIGASTSSATADVRPARPPTLGPALMLGERRQPVRPGLRQGPRRADRRPRRITHVRPGLPPFLLHQRRARGARRCSGMAEDFVED